MERHPLEQWDPQVGLAAGWRQQPGRSTLGRECEELRLDWGTAMTLQAAALWATVDAPQWPWPALEILVGDSPWAVPWPSQSSEHCRLDSQIRCWEISLARKCAKAVSGAAAWEDYQSWRQ